MEHAEQAILEGKGECEDGARNVVGLAHDSISWLGEQEGAVILGSSTICLGLVRPGGLLEMANVGDSGFRVIRGDETVFASEVRCLQGIKPCSRLKWRMGLASSLPFALLHIVSLSLRMEMCSAVVNTEVNSVVCSLQHQRCCVGDRFASLDLC